MLTAIRGNITLAELSPSAGNPDMKDRLQSANHATQRAADLFKQLHATHAGAMAIICVR